ncbi:MAG TPA: hypothetical protein VGK99_14515 [Acidobacteriota bacterium]
MTRLVAQPRAALTSVEPGDVVIITLADAHTPAGALLAGAPGCMLAIHRKPESPG